MKNKSKNYFLATALSIAAIAAFNISINADWSKTSNISLENVEALAQETNAPICVPTKGFCYSNGIRTSHIAIE